MATPAAILAAVFAAALLATTRDVALGGQNSLSIRATRS